MPVWGVSFPFDLIVSFTPKGLHLDGQFVPPRYFSPSDDDDPFGRGLVLGFLCHENLMDA